MRNIAWSRTTLAVALVALSAFPMMDAVGATLHIRVIERETGKGIASEIFIYRNKTELSLCQTDENGMATVSNYVYNVGDRIFAKPDGNKYIPTLRKSPNTDRLVLEASPIWRVIALKEKAADLNADGEFGKAALVFNEVYARSHDEAARADALIAAGKALDLAEGEAIAFDPQQGMNVASHELVGKLKELQAQNGITAPSGQLDSQTLKSLARASLTETVGTAIWAQDSNAMTRQRQSSN